MICSIFMLFIGTAILSAVVSYAGWRWLRVELLRQRLFLIRKRLWSSAHEHGGFNDPAYLQARTHLNAAIHIADMIGIPTFAFFARFTEERGELAEAEMRVSSDQELQLAIDAAYKDSAECIHHHLVRHTFFGLFCLTIAWCYHHVRKLTGPLNGLRDLFCRISGEPIEEPTIHLWLRSTAPATWHEAERLAIAYGSRHGR